MKTSFGWSMAVTLLAGCAAATTALAAPLTVGSKRFTESYILGEILKQAAETAGESSAVHQRGLGNTAIVLNALTSGSIDIYPEYTGTIAREILKLDCVRSDRTETGRRHRHLLDRRQDRPLRVDRARRRQ